MLQPFAIAPNFIVADAAAAAAYYRDRLGFVVALTTGEPVDFVIVQGPGEATLFLKSRAGVTGSFSNQRGHADLGWDAYLCVTDVDALHAEFRHRGARVTRAPEDAPYGFRDFEVEDPDGYLLCFGQDLGGPASG